MRLDSKVQKLSLSEIGSSLKDAVVLVRYPDDEGVKNNGGRVGAALGPESILQALLRMPVRDSMPPLLVLQDQLPLNEPLAKRHEIAQDWVEQLFKKGMRVISLGGGHDYAYPDIAALWNQKAAVPVVNVDAHLDVRPLENQVINSGTAFRRLADNFELCPLIQWGIQWSFNSKEHLEFCHSKKIPVWALADEIPLPEGQIAFSICLDAFEGIRAVSAPNFFGLKASSVMRCFEQRLNDMNWLGLYEVAPDLSPDSCDSARLAAQFAYRFIMREAFASESSLLQ